MTDLNKRNHSHIFFLIAGAFLSSALLAQTPNYFPLQTGNSWLYRLKSNTNAADDQFRSISVEGKQKIGDLEYFTVRYFGREVLLRDDPASGTITAFDRQSGTEQPWLSLGLAEGETFPTTIDQCATTGQIASRNAPVTTPVGEFNGAVQVRFQGTCADAGTTQQFFVPSVGPAIHEETSFAGPRQYELVYFRAGALSFGRPEVSFTVALNAAKFPLGSSLDVRLTLRSTSPDPLLLHFPSGQSFDLKIYNEAGAVVYTWSANRLFPLIVRDETFGPGERTYALTAPLNNLPQGRYKAQGYLTTAPVMFLGEAAFEITPPSATQ